VPPPDTATSDMPAGRPRHSHARIPHTLRGTAVRHLIPSLPILALMLFSSGCEGDAADSGGPASQQASPAQPVMGSFELPDTHSRSESSAAT
jgi:hypothetical protein